MPIWITLLLFSFLLGSCMATHSKVASEGNFSIDQFVGTYTWQRGDEKARKHFGEHMTISKGVDQNALSALLAKPLKTGLNALQVDLNDTKRSIYFLGVNSGSVDYVHYEFRDKLIAFDRTKSSLKGNQLTLRQNAMIYEDGKTKKNLRAAGFLQIHRLQLTRSELVYTREIKQLRQPWISVFPPNDEQKQRVLKAVYRQTRRLPIRSASDRTAR